jgi:hypothetical protein
VTVKQLIQPIIKKSKKEGINEERKRGLDHCSVQIIMTDFSLWKRVIMIFPLEKGDYHFLPWKRVIMISPFRKGGLRGI